jgi:succinate dehydrogenase/fumarate reductase flavoprotein subunit
MWDKAGIEKDENSLNAALDDIDRLRIELLPRIRLAYKGRNANYEWLDAIDLMNMIDACELIIHSSIERRESRGPFMRRDFPMTDNTHWLTANVMVKTDNGFRFEQRPYELAFFQPDFATKDNLEVAW